MKKTSDFNLGRIQVISAILAITQLCAQIVQKTPSEVFGNPTLFEGGD